MSELNPTQNQTTHRFHLNSCGVVATGLAIFRWTENSTTIYLLGDFARCAHYWWFFGGINRLNDNQRFLETTANSDNPI